jgi:hypothetical protein
MANRMTKDGLGSFFPAQLNDRVDVSIPKKQTGRPGFLSQGAQPCFFLP